MTQFTLTGRLLQGDVYRQSQRVDNNGKKVFNADGSPQMQTYFAVGVPKGDPNLPTVRAGIESDARGYWPAGESARRDFAWKIVDGDSTDVNKKNKRWCDYEGFPGHLVFKFGSLYPCKVQYWDPSAPNRHGGVGDWVDSNGGHVECGDYVSICFDTASNKSTQTPGIHLNPKLVGFERKGDRIVTNDGPDGGDVFGARGGQPGAPASPPAYQPAPAASPPPPAASAAPALPTAAPTEPYTGYMAAAPAAPPAEPTMTAAANGISYSEYRAKGWTDDQLRQHGMIV